MLVFWSILISLFLKLFQSYFMSISLSGLHGTLTINHVADACAALVGKFDQICLEESTNGFVEREGKIHSHRVRVSRWH
jgi:hypothetical protein